MESGYLLGSISAALSRAVTSPSAIVFVYEYHEVYPVDIFSNLKETLTYPESELLTPGVELGGGGEELSFLASKCHILIPEYLSFKNFSGGAYLRSPGGDRIRWSVPRVPISENLYPPHYLSVFPYVWSFIHPTMKK